ncbi:MAG: sigma-70 family RNA polymerase sigma factor [Chloroflexi bacterium]|nr:sigma-70 family RNA polymerase sigma factor [Chloroflexota bacterium]MCI0644438.1 sigma-70 family RNA polymerase sigma factor [Chloroflexota bacterium]MCI0725398.1 sigma-70 family RNA polymerase sigma factor [Chloroflexota bacterium]
MFSVALAIIGDRATAGEITLDVFVHVWQRAGTYRAEQARVSTWLTAITRHHAIDVLRRQNSRSEAHSVSWDEIALPAGPAARELEERVELSLKYQRVRAAVAQLPAEQQQALALAYFKGYTHHQIAEALKQPLGTIKTRIRLAMQKLRKMLPEE